MVNYTENEMRELLVLIKKQIKAPYVEGYVSTLGGSDSASVLISISKDNKSTWEYGYLENSAYGKYHIGNDGVIEQISGSLTRMRKTRFKSFKEAIIKLNKYVASAKSRY